MSMQAQEALEESILVLGEDSDLSSPGSHHSPADEIANAMASTALDSTAKNVVFKISGPAHVHDNQERITRKISFAASESDKPTWPMLARAIRLYCPTEPARRFGVTWTDEDGDEIAVSTDAELRECYTSYSASYDDKDHQTLIDYLASEKQDKPFVIRFELLQLDKPVLGGPSNDDPPEMPLEPPTGPHPGHGRSGRGGRGGPRGGRGRGPWHGHHDHSRRGPRDGPPSDLGSSVESFINSIRGIVDQAGPELQTAVQAIVSDALDLAADTVAPTVSDSESDLEGEPTRNASDLSRNIIESIGQVIQGALGQTRAGEEPPFPGMPRHHGRAHFGHGHPPPPPHRAGPPHRHGQVPPPATFGMPPFLVQMFGGPPHPPFAPHPPFGGPHHAPPHHGPPGEPEFDGPPRHSPFHGPPHSGPRGDFPGRRHGCHGPHGMPHGRGRRDHHEPPRERHGRHEHHHGSRPSHRMPVDSDFDCDEEY
ncbi:uncharacterized protein L969DRAFT_14788 [Mixia osmundae IAM 14324]|nr:uncharacterized protein L969DRAFT_14788 [Mixia osmundae IAM 14324]KEI42596.1 hypothetical protein L969DRAFT_14788 [Mixia osmundae IAM 14324]